MDEIKIEDCRRRKRIYNKMLKLIHNGKTFGFYSDELEALKIALARSVAIEQLNIKNLKEKQK